MVLIFKEKDVAREKDLESKFTRETFPTFLKNMETLLATRGGKHFVGNQVLTYQWLMSGLANLFGNMEQDWFCPVLWLKSVSGIAVG